jgi:hypothetical protein
MFKKLGLAMLLIGSLAGGAYAGYKSSAPVYVDTTARVAWGAMGTARNSSDANQNIGCAIWGGTGTIPEAYCSATDQNGVSLSCYGTNANVIAAAHAVTTDSWIYFNVDGAGNCTTLYVYNYGEYSPKQP